MTVLTSYFGSAQFGSQPGHYHNWDFCDLIQFLQVNTRMLSQITPWPLSSALFPLHYLHSASIFDFLQSKPLTELQNKPWTNQNHCCHNTTNKQANNSAFMTTLTNKGHCCHGTMGKQKTLMSWHHGQTESTDVMAPWANRNYCSYDTTGKQKAQLSWHLSHLCLISSFVTIPSLVTL